MLWYEEHEHMVRLANKCNGTYKLFIFDFGQEPPFIKHENERGLQGYIFGPDLSDDKIEYATQASEGIYIMNLEGYDVCQGHIHYSNFYHLENRMYIRLSPDLQSNIKSLQIDNDGCYTVKVHFEVKHSYFDHLQQSGPLLPRFVLDSLFPTHYSFYPMISNDDGGEYYSQFHFMILDRGNQWRAFQMIISDPPNNRLSTYCLPPVIVRGPFGTGKTRIIARSAYEIMMRGLYTNQTTRILISAHHKESTESFIHNFFGRIENKMRDLLPFKVIKLGLSVTSEKFSHLYMSLQEFSKEAKDIAKCRHVLIIATYTTCLNLCDILRKNGVTSDGYFTHILLDEAAQVREPEAIAPLTLATRNTKIVLAGDEQQVGPKTLVLGDEAKKCGLHISLLERLMKHYKQYSPESDPYVINLQRNYRSHQSLIPIPQLFYDFRLETASQDFQHRRANGPSGYSFVCSDSRLVPSYISKDHPLVEACIVLEEALAYLAEKKDNYRPKNICVISPRNQLSIIKKMASTYKCYEKLIKICYIPPSNIQGCEFDAIFISMLNPDDYDKDIPIQYMTKSLFNPYVFNTVITRARERVVAVGKPVEVLDFECGIREMGETKCWFEYIKHCKENNTLSHAKLEEQAINEVLTKIEKQIEQDEPHGVELPSQPAQDEKSISQLVEECEDLKHKINELEKSKSVQKKESEELSCKLIQEIETLKEQSRQIFNELEEEKLKVKEKEDTNEHLILQVEKLTKEMLEIKKIADEKEKSNCLLVNENKELKVELEIERLRTEEIEDYNNKLRRQLVQARQGTET
jgi:hypothetical protein